MRNQVVRFCLWLIKKLGYETYVLTPLLLSVLPATTKLVEEWESVNVSGEYKRHQVYSKLIKKFPFIPKNELGRAIEEALWRIR